MPMALPPTTDKIVPERLEKTRAAALGDDSPAAHRSRSAQRTRRYRERRGRGEVLIRFSVIGPALNRLAALGWLDPAKRDEREAVRGAVVRLAARALALQLRPDS
jgi:hypothetical protein